MPTAPFEVVNFENQSAEELKDSVQPLARRLHDARRQSDALFRLIRPGHLYDRPIPERHRIIFYIGHLEAFDRNLLHEAINASPENVRPEFDRLFAFGIDPVAGGLPSDQPSDWPSLHLVDEYVGRVRNALDDRLADPLLTLTAHVKDGFSLATLLHVAIEHRLMHLETLAYMFHQLPLDTKIRHTNSLHLAGAPIQPGMVSIPAGRATLGLARTSNQFGWDNEFESHSVDVPAFHIDRYKVTNRQYLAFVADGGYDNRSFWNDDDWNWKTAAGISQPAFWKRDGNRWLWRTMFDEVPLPLDWPVYVSHAEAAAYARWAGKSLPTEGEWQRAAYGASDGDERLYPWGNHAPTSRLGNFDFHRWDPAPVHSFPRGQSAFGVHDLLGNGWEWTSTVFAPFPAFKPFPFYRGYSADFFDGKHFVIKGASSRTAACMLRPTFRNWFQAHYQYVYAGFRCVSR
jgi:gamma-glutamyl hercynylcysteine S-oxide synthase